MWTFSNSEPSGSALLSICYLSYIILNPLQPVSQDIFFEHIWSHTFPLQNQTRISLNNMDILWGAAWSWKQRTEHNRYPHWKWLQKHFTPFPEISWKRECEGREQLLQATSTMFASRGQNKVGQNLISFQDPKALRANGAYGQHEEIRWSCTTDVIHIWLHIIMLGVTRPLEWTSNMIA